MKWSSGDENPLGIDDKPIQRWGGFHQRLRNEFRPADTGGVKGGMQTNTDALCTRNNQPGARGVEPGEAENLREVALMHI